jgi:NAD(P)-dependent dehydrogenase (short-subunit alcohol dehydrogenase family)
MAFSIDQFRLDGKVAVITGAGGRGNSIGRAYALGLGKAVAVGVDITKPDSVKNMASAARDAFGGVDILVNNAALMAELGYLPAIDIPLDQWNRIMDVNLTGALNCAQAIVPLMRQRGGGKIVNQVSGGAFPAQSVYGISKLALVGLTTTLARQLGREKINVNAIAPGNTMSDAGKLLEATVAMRVRGQPDELVGTLLLLCSSAGDWITGQVLHVDGGWVLRP